MKNDKKDNKKKIKNVKVTLALAFTALAASGCTVAKHGIEKNERFDQTAREKFHTNLFNIPRTLHIENGTVKINIKDCFNEEQLNLIKKGIEELDTMAKNINFEIHFNEPNLKKAINISASSSETFLGNLEYKRKTGTCVAHCLYTPNILTTEIQYPINVRFNTELINQGRNIDRIVKHEILHAFGFKDLYDEKDENNLMYYMNSDGSMSDEEIEIFNKVYSAKYTGYSDAYETELPSKIEYHTITEENEYNNELN